MALSMGCKNQSEGLAPSTQLPPDGGGPTSSMQTQMKFGETQFASGWEVSLDTADPVETIELANGWTVEVMHE
jgi:hypothetical protein